MSGDRIEPPSASPGLHPRWPTLLAAGRAWKNGLITGTSTTTHNLAQNLIDAIEAFDEPDPLTKEKQ